MSAAVWFDFFLTQPYEQFTKLRTARWALALGLRQGEALGLTWDDVDLEKGTIRIHRSRLRPKYAHVAEAPAA